MIETERVRRAITVAQEGGCHCSACEILRGEHDKILNEWPKPEQPVRLIAYNACFSLTGKKLHWVAHDRGTTACGRVMDIDWYTMPDALNDFNEDDIPTEECVRCLKALDD